MKYAIIIPDGCADEPQESLGGRTPLQAAHTPNMDAIAATGVVGRANNVPPSLPAGSDVATLSLLGYSPLEYFTGRAPLEAAAQGIALGPNDAAIRCNLVTIGNQTMKSFTAGHISSEEARALLQTAQEKMGGPELEFVPGVSYRNLLMYRGGKNVPPFSIDTRAMPPHDLTDKSVLDDYPRGPGSDLLNRLMGESVASFADHPVNRSSGLPPVNFRRRISGSGDKGGHRRRKSFAELYGKRGAMITAVDLLRGVAALLGWQRIEVPGATGYLDTDYAAKGRYAIEALPDTDVICVHVEATDEASHEGRADAKIQALEEIDRHIVGPLHEAPQQGEYRILISPDHPTPLRTKTHSHGFVPFTIAGANITADQATTYDEVAAENSTLSFPEGWKLMQVFLSC